MSQYIKWCWERKEMVRKNLDLKVEQFFRRLKSQFWSPTFDFQHLKCNDFVQFDLLKVKKIHLFHGSIRQLLFQLTIHLLICGISTAIPNFWTQEEFLKKQLKVSAQSSLSLLLFPSLLIFLFPYLKKERGRKGGRGEQLFTWWLFCVSHFMFTFIFSTN